MTTWKNRSALIDARGGLNHDGVTALDDLSERDKLRFLASHQSMKFISEEQTRKLVEDAGSNTSAVIASNQQTSLATTEASQLMVEASRRDAERLLESGTQNTQEIVESNQRIAYELGELREDLISVGTGIENAVGEATCAIETGFINLSQEMAGLQVGLDKILKAVSNPSQIWAYEQYDIARAAYQRKLYADALESGSRAINGYGDHPGFKLDQRLHFLLGLICADSAMGDEQVLRDAEDHFTAAVKYATQEKEKATACLHAAMAAFARNEFDRSEKFALQATKNSEVCPHAHYHIGRIQMRRGDIAAASTSVVQAVRSSGGKFLIDALCDEDYGDCWQSLCSFAREYREPRSEQSAVVSYAIGLVLSLRSETAGSLLHLDYAQSDGGVVFLIRAIRDASFLGLGRPLRDYLVERVNADGLVFSVPNDNTKRAIACHNLALFLHDRGEQASTATLIDSAYRFNGARYLSWAIRDASAAGFITPLSGYIASRCLAGRSPLDKDYGKSLNADFLYELGQFMSVARMPELALELLDGAFAIDGGCVLDRALADERYLLSGEVLKPYVSERFALARSILEPAQSKLKGIYQQAMAICQDFDRGSALKGILARVSERMALATGAAYDEAEQSINGYIPTIQGEIDWCVGFLRGRIEEIQATAKEAGAARGVVIAKNKETIFKATSWIVGILGVITWIVGIIGEKGFLLKLFAIVVGGIVMGIGIVVSCFVLGSIAKGVYRLAVPSGSQVEKEALSPVADLEDRITALLQLRDGGAVMSKLQAVRARRSVAVAQPVLSRP